MYCPTPHAEHTGFAAERPDATEVDLAWAIVEEMSLRAAPLLLPTFEASGGRQGRLSMQTDPTPFRSFERVLAQGEHGRA